MFNFKKKKKIPVKMSGDPGGKNVPAFGTTYETSARDLAVINT